MSISVSSATHVQTPVAVQPAAARQPGSNPQPTPQVKAQPAATDTVKISAAAQALQEAIETPTQTAKEARSGDTQAKKLLAKEAAAHAVTK